jgi:hypothetical protein
VSRINEREFANHKPDFDREVKKQKGSCCHGVANYVAIKKRTIFVCVRPKRTEKGADVYAGPMMP